jgi:hypothetical protein
MASRSKDNAVAKNKFSESTSNRSVMEKVSITFTSISWVREHSVLQRYPVEHSLMREPTGERDVLTGLLGSP